MSSSISSVSSYPLNSNTKANANVNLYGAGGGSGVSSVAGTTNQISATTTAGAVVVALAPPSPAPTAGQYTNANITVDALGRITAAASGSPSGNGVSSVNGVNGAVVLTSSTDSLVISPSGQNVDLNFASSTAIVRNIGAGTGTSGKIILNAKVPSLGPPPTTGSTIIYSFDTVAGTSYNFTLSIPLAYQTDPGAIPAGAFLRTFWTAPPSNSGTQANYGMSVPLTQIQSLAGSAQYPTELYFYTQSGFFTANAAVTTCQVQIALSGGDAGSNIIPVGSLAAIGGTVTDLSFCVINPVALIGA